MEKTEGALIKRNGVNIADVKVEWDNEHGQL